MPAPADLLLVNARIITLDPARPRSESVALAGDTVLAVGRYADLKKFRHSRTAVIDCRGHTLIPGLNDAHCHLLATAAALTALDCGPPAILSLADLQGAIRRRAGETPPGQWLRGYGLEPAALLEGRYPTRWELDAVASEHPVRLEHSSGHAAVLNSYALALAGIDAATPDPPEGILRRDETTGEPDGVLLEMSSWLRDRLGNTRSPAELAAGVSRLSQNLLRYGITSAQDAGPHNGLTHWQTFQSLTQAGHFRPRLTLMAGVANLEQFAPAGLSWSSGDDRLRLGHAKIMLTLTTGAMHPGPAELAELVSAAHKLGFPVAIHAIEQEAVAAVAALQGMAQPLPAGPIKGIPAAAGYIPRNRIEHCAEGPPKLLAKLRRQGVTVVTQPGFIYWRGESYRERVSPELLPHLYPIAALAQAGIPLAFGSDAPVIDPSPWPALYSAITGRTAAGQPLFEDKAGGQPMFAGKTAGPNPGLTLTQALRAYTHGGAWAEGMETRKGIIRPGMLADLALVDTDLTRANAAALKDTQVRLTLLGGEVVWDDGIAG